MTGGAQLQGVFFILPAMLELPGAPQGLHASPPGCLPPTPARRTDLHGGRCLQSVLLASAGASSWRLGQDGGVLTRPQVCAGRQGAGVDGHLARAGGGLRPGQWQRCPDADALEAIPGAGPHYLRMQAARQLHNLPNGATAAQPAEDMQHVCCHCECHRCPSSRDAVTLPLCTCMQAQVQAWLRASNGEQQAPPRQVQRMVKRSLQAMEGCLREGNLPWQAIDQVCSAPAVSAVLGPGVLFS